MKDVRVGLAEPSVELEDGADETAKVALCAEAARWLRKRSAEGEDDKPMRKRHRVKAYEFLLSADNAMLAVTGKGWKHYQIPVEEADRAPPQE